MTPEPVVVTLDRPRRIAFTNHALYRMGTLRPAFELGDIIVHGRSYAATIAWLWACLVPADQPDFPTPEALAPHVAWRGEMVEVYLTALNDAIARATETGSPKNAHGSTPGPSPASS